MRPPDTGRKLSLSRIMHVPLQNRVDPFGEIHAVPTRGTLMGNRGGCLHDNRRQLGRRRWTSRRWIACVLAFKGRHRTIMTPGRYTELFFLDEATALAAGATHYFSMPENVRQNSSFVRHTTRRPCPTGMACAAQPLDSLGRTRTLARSPLTSGAAPRRLLPRTESRTGDWPH
jgi:hypothetical protein